MAQGIDVAVRVAVVADVVVVADPTPEHGLGRRVREPQHAALERQRHIGRFLG